MSSSTDNTIVGKTNCVHMFQYVASRESGHFIGTHTPDFESVRTDVLSILGRFPFNEFYCDVSRH